MLQKDDRKHWTYIHLAIRSGFIAALAMFALLTIATIGQKEQKPHPGEPLPDIDPSAIADDDLQRNLNAVPLSDPVNEWNQYAVTMTLATSAALSPVQQTRVMAIFHIAVNDSVNGITTEYDTYFRRVRPPRNASATAAAIASAHRALVGLFPNQVSNLDTLFANSIATNGVSLDDPGIAYGRLVADLVLAARSNDGSGQAQFEYTPPGAGTPGVWTRINNAPALLPGWGNVTTFVLKSSSQFRPGPPPALDSLKYAADYNEVKSIGAVNSATRTVEQSQIATFWRSSPTTIWNSVMRQSLATRTFDLSKTARAYGLLYLAAADASIANWEAKYYYNFWRPQLAIRGGDSDGNPDTDPDLAWLPFVSTPPHPEYPSTHATNTAAMATVIKSIFGPEPDVPIVVTLSGITREWMSYDEAVREVIDARVYSGIHFRNSDIVGARLGRKVARYAITHSLKPNCRRHDK